MDLSLLQKDAANIIGVSEDCITYWENGRSIPQIQFMPQIVKFLRYNPFNQKTDTLGGKIRNYRILHGLSHKKLGKILGVDASTISSWESSKFLPTGVRLKKLNEFLK